MVEVFKTTVSEEREGQKILKALKNEYPGARIHFDLEDCDNILRIEADEIDLTLIQTILAKSGHKMEVLSCSSTDMKNISRMSKEDYLQIENTLFLFEMYWNRKDLKMVSLFSESAEFTDIMGQIAIGRESIEAMHRIVFQKVMKHAILSQEILYMREIDPNIVLVTTKWVTKGHTDDRNIELPDRKGIMQVVLTKDSNSWLISMVQNFDFTAMYNDIDNYTMKVFGKQF